MSDLVSCPHCFGEKPSAAKVCLHCGRDEQGFGPMVRTDALASPYRHISSKRPSYSDLRVLSIAAVIVTALGFIMMLSSGLGALLFIFGIVLLLTTRLRLWWRQQRWRTSFKGKA
jgi:uncharacterized membrane protein YfcA